MIFFSLRIPYAVACQHLIASWRGSSESLALVSEKCIVYPITFWRSAQILAKHSLSRLQVSRKGFILVMHLKKAGESQGFNEHV